MRKRFLLIVNPIAGIAGSRLLSEVVAALEAIGATVATVSPSSGPDARRCAREACRSGEFDAVVAVGGDGVIRQVATGALGTDVPIGIVPTGTANVLAHEIGIGADPREIALTLVEGRAVPIQGGIANDEPFLLMVGAGFDGRVTAGVNRGVQRRFGKSAYARPILQALFDPLDEIDVAVDNVPYKASWVIVTNSRFYGGSFVLDPRATVFKGGLCAVLFQAGSRIAQACQLLALARGKLHSRKDVQAIECKHVIIGASHPTPTQVDGDPFGSTPLEVQVGQETVRVIVGARSDHPVPRPR